MEAARFVVSDAVAALLDRTLTRDGSAALAEHAMPQPARWESRFGWTRTGLGAVSEGEISLASVFAGLLGGPDATDPQGCVVSIRTAPFPSDLPISVLEQPRHTGLRLGR
jgi:hypothetical protein